MIRFKPHEFNLHPCNKSNSTILSYPQPWKLTFVLQILHEDHNSQVQQRQCRNHKKYDPFELNDHHERPHSQSCLRKTVLLPNYSPHTLLINPKEIYSTTTEQSQRTGSYQPVESCLMRKSCMTTAREQLFCEIARMWTRSNVVESVRNP